MLLTWQGKVIIIAREVVVPARTALAFAAWSHDGGDTDQVIAHGAGESEKGARFPTEAFKGTVVRELASTQEHRGGKEVEVRCHAQRKGGGGDGGGIGEGGFPGADGIGGGIDVVVAAFAF